LVFVSCSTNQSVINDIPHEGQVTKLPGGTADEYIRMKLLKSAADIRACILVEDRKENFMIKFKFEIKSGIAKVLSIEGAELKTHESECLTKVIEEISFKLVKDSEVTQEVSFYPRKKTP
jgi:hypothetical protein